ncbi:MAG: prolyl oligopeptidase family serine peptidase [Gemmatimonadetes bacterium]|nr:prolyl oligopeptidase family serine peptidase [Gemmatimonadota bacterium]
MLASQFVRTSIAVAALAGLSPLAAQNAPSGRGNQSPNAAPAPVNPLADLPYAATTKEAVSRWTPPASVGRQLTLNDLVTWKGIRGTAVSNDGRWFAYTLAPTEGDGDVVVRGTAAGAREMRFPIGEVGGGGRGGAPTISGNNRWVAFNVNASANAGRGGRGAAPGRAGGAAPTPAGPAAQPKLAIVDLNDGSKREFESVRAYRFAGDKSNWLAIHHAVPSGAAAAGAAAAGGRGGAAGLPPAPASVLELVDLGTPGSLPMQIANVSEFAFTDDGAWLAYAVSAPDQVGNSVQLRELNTGVTRTIDAAKAQYRRLTWGDSSAALSAMRLVSDSASGDELATILVWANATTLNARPIEVTSKANGITGGLVISADRAVTFNRSRSSFTFGLREPRPPREPAAGGGGAAPAANAPAPGAGAGGQIAAAPQTSPDVPSLILWHWKDPRTQSSQQVQEAADRAFSYVAVYDITSQKVTKLADDKLRTVQTGPLGTWAVGNDISAYERDASIRGFTYRDMYAVNMATGERKAIQTKLPGQGGGSFSPDNAKYAYYDMGHWKVYDFASGQTRTITQGVPAIFWDDEDDHNQVKPAIGGGFVGWSKDGKYALVRDNWDVWRVSLDGPASAALNLTGNGKKEQIRYQLRVAADPRTAQDGIDLSQPLYFETYGEWTKKEGLARVDGMKGGATRITWEDAKVDFRKARDADVWVYSRQTVKNAPDFYAADDGIRNERKLTDIGAQTKDIAWSPGMVLIDYTCEQGLGRRQAALFLPAGYEKGKRYPTLTYIYEKLSQGAHVFPEPNATRYSHPGVYTSRGYAFLQPDIAYKINDPGRSALWCVVPAVKAAIAAGYVDAGRVGLQGHSWGGYQSSFLATQTKVFKTIVSGAPLTDMTSMFGSIYWNSGNTDGSIFISSQGRFTGGPNDVPEAYDRNSPQKFVQNVSSPIMVLHNDRDGAVDFNQGITWYNHLRQMNKEVVLLEYVGENHGLARPANQKDYALRMTEWFDALLRDQPAPEWMKEGVPRLRMEQHLKDRRTMVDPKAAPTAARITP